MNGGDDWQSLAGLQTGVSSGVATLSGLRHGTPPVITFYDYAAVPQCIISSTRWWFDCQPGVESHKEVAGFCSSEWSSLQDIQVFYEEKN